MNFYEALTVAVKDGKKIRQTNWGAGVYATSDERGYLTRQDGEEINMYYNGGAKGTWEIYSRCARFKDVKVGEKFNFRAYPELSPLMRIDQFQNYNAITKCGKGIIVCNDTCVEIVE